MPSLAYANAMTETLWYFKGIRQEDIKKIPEKVMDYLMENSNKEYKCDFDYNLDMSELNLLDETKVLITSICYSYWCEDELEKKQLKEILAQNEKAYDTWQRELYSPDNIFKENKQEKVTQDVEVAMIEQPKENAFSRLLKKIKSLFSKGK